MAEQKLPSQGTEVNKNSTRYTSVVSPKKKKKKKKEVKKIIKKGSGGRITGSQRITSIITKTRLYNFDPLKPHFYIVKLGFTRVYIIFLILLKKDRLWVLVRTASSRRF